MEVRSCRVCLTKYEESFLGLFDTFIESLRISECLQFVCSINVNENDHLPKYLCPVCLDKVRIAYEVKVQSIETERFLKECLAINDSEFIETEYINQSNIKLEDLNDTETLIEYHSEEYLKDIENEISSKEEEEGVEYILTLNDVDPVDSSKVTVTDPNKPFIKCFICNQLFQQKTKKLEHIAQQHEHGGSHQCHICNYILKTAKKLDIHVKYHYHPPEYVCELCGKGFANKENLKIHQNMHTSSINFSCDHCSKSFKYKENLRRHVKLHLADKRFRCDECNEGYTTQGCLNNHLYKCHNLEAPIKCSDCNRGFTYMSELRNHKNRFGKCPVPRSESEKYEKNHIAINPVNNKYKCTICHREYKHLRALQFHLKFHSEHRPIYKCDQCFKNFHNSGNLQRHKMIHQNIKPHKCEYCDKAFIQKEKLIVHRRIHTGEKPYECLKCLKKFADPSCFTKHIKNIHNETNKN